jgi:probable phosphoglycerate mutase
MTRSPSPDRGEATRPSAWLIRHGETEWSRLGKHTGRTDIPLTDLGRQQAVEAGSKIKGHAFARAISSPLSRARARMDDLDARGPRW